jgi:hypothetical protein
MKWMGVVYYIIFLSYQNFQKYILKYIETY